MGNVGTLKEYNQKLERVILSYERGEITYKELMYKVVDLGFWIETLARNSI